MIYALVKNGLVENVIVAKPEFAKGLEKNFDHVLDVSEEPNRPGPGWTYDGEKFSAPVEPGPTPEELARAQKISELKALAQDQTKIPIQGPELQALLKKLIEAVL